MIFNTYFYLFPGWIFEQLSFIRFYFSINAEIVIMIYLSLCISQ